MEAKDFFSLIGQSQQEMKEKNDVQQSMFKFDQFQKWKFEKDAGLLIFSNPDGFKLVLPVQLVGTLQIRNWTWTWGWAITGVPDTIRLDAQKVKEWGLQNGAPPLVEPLASMNEEQALDLLALTVHLCKANGGMGLPSPSNDGAMVYLYFTFRKILQTKEPELEKIQESLRKLQA